MYPHTFVRLTILLAGHAMAAKVKAKKPMTIVVIWEARSTELVVNLCGKVTFNWEVGV
jgi:hypothetical protein